MKYNIDNLPSQYAKAIRMIKVVADLYRYDVYIVGGFVRDLLMGKVSDDIDFVVDKIEDDNPATSFANLLYKEGVGSNMAVYETFGTSKVEVNGLKVEFVMPRAEAYRIDNRKPSVIKTTLYEDAIRRDFTVNTLIMTLDGDILDLLGKGIDDINNKILRSANSNIDQMFMDDSLRILRLYRQSITKGFKIEPFLLDGAVRYAHKLETISKERIREELNKMIMGDNLDIMLTKEFIETLKYICPELYNETTNMETPPYHKIESTWEHTVRVTSNCPKDNFILRLAALFHDVGKPVVRTIEENGNAHFYRHELVGAKMAKDIMTKLTYSNDVIKKVTKLIENHMRGMGYNKKWSDKAIRKFIIELNPLMEDNLLLAYADSKGSAYSQELENNSLNRLNEMKNRIKEIMKKPVHMKPIIDGDELMRISGRGTGEWIGEAIRCQMKILMKDPEISVEELRKKLIMSIGEKNNDNSLG